MKKFLHLMLSVIFIGFSATSLEGAFTIKEGKIVDVDNVAIFSAQEHYNLGLEALEYSEWKEAAKQFNIIVLNFPKTSQCQDAYYYLGVAYYNLCEYDFANDAFSEYLKCHSNPQFFEECVTYKFAIANKFKSGAKKRFFGWKQLPKWAPSSSLAIQIYDEVIAAMPCSDIAAQALFAKAGFLLEQRSYRESIEAYQQIIRRFPKNELAPQSYVEISKVYLEQCQYEIQNPDLLAFEQINLRKFQLEFPRDEQISLVEQDLQKMKENYAQSLFETGQFYERKKHPKASVIYYNNAIKQFPDTHVAIHCRNRLIELTGSCPQISTEDNLTNHDVENDASA